MNRKMKHNTSGPRGVCLGHSFIKVIGLNENYTCGRRYCTNCCDERCPEIAVRVKRKQYDNVDCTKTGHRFVANNSLHECYATDHPPPLYLDTSPRLSFSDASCETHTEHSTSHCDIMCAEKCSPQYRQIVEKCDDKRLKCRRSRSACRGGKVEAIFVSSNDLCPEYCEPCYNEPLCADVSSERCNILRVGPRCDRDATCRDGRSSRPTRRKCLNIEKITCPRVRSRCSVNCMCNNCVKIIRDGECKEGYRLHLCEDVCPEYSYDFKTCRQRRPRCKNARRACPKRYTSGDMRIYACNKKHCSPNSSVYYKPCQSDEEALEVQLSSPTSQECLLDVEVEPCGSKCQDECLSSCCMCPRCDVQCLKS